MAGGGPARRAGVGRSPRGKKKYWFFTIYSCECFEISKVIYSKSSLTAAAAAGGMKEYEKRIYGKHIIVSHVVNVFGAVYTDRKNWGFSTSSSYSRRRRRRCCVHRTEAEKL